MSRPPEINPINFTPFYSPEPTLCLVPSLRIKDSSGTARNKHRPKPNLNHFTNKFILRRSRTLPARLAAATSDAQSRERFDNEEQITSCCNFLTFLLITIGDGGRRWRSCRQALPDRKESASSRERMERTRREWKNFPASTLELPTGLLSQKEVG